MHNLWLLGARYLDLALLDHGSLKLAVPVTFENFFKLRKYFFLSEFKKWMWEICRFITIRFSCILKTFDELKNNIGDTIAKMDTEIVDKLIKNFRFGIEQNGGHLP